MLKFPIFFPKNLRNPAKIGGLKRGDHLGQKNTTLATSMYKNTEKNTKKFTEKNTEKFFCIFFCKIFCKFFRIFFCIFFNIQIRSSCSIFIAIHFNIWAISCSNIEKIALKLLFELHIWILKKIQKKIRKNLQKILQKKIQKNCSIFFPYFFLYFYTWT